MDMVRIWFSLYPYQHTVVIVMIGVIPMDLVPIVIITDVVAQMVVMCPSIIIKANLDLSLVINRSFYAVK